jgi:hypothetical protein
LREYNQFIKREKELVDSVPQFDKSLSLTIDNIENIFTEINLYKISKIVNILEHDRIPTIILFHIYFVCRNNFEKTIIKPKTSLLETYALRIIQRDELMKLHINQDSHGKKDTWAEAFDKSKEFRQIVSFDELKKLADLNLIIFDNVSQKKKKSWNTIYLTLTGLLVVYFLPKNLLSKVCQEEYSEKSPIEKLNEIKPSGIDKLPGLYINRLKLIEKSLRIIDKRAMLKGSRIIRFTGEYGQGKSIFVKLLQYYIMEKNKAIMQMKDVMNIKINLTRILSSTNSLDQLREELSEKFSLELNSEDPIIEFINSKDEIKQRNSVDGIMIELEDFESFLIYANENPLDKFVADFLNQLVFRINKGDVRDIILVFEHHNYDLLGNLLVTHYEDEDIFLSEILKVPILELMDIFPIFIESIYYKIIPLIIHDSKSMFYEKKFIKISQLFYEALNSEFIKGDLITSERSSSDLIFSFTEMLHELHNIFIDDSKKPIFKLNTMIDNLQKINRLDFIESKIINFSKIFEEMAQNTNLMELARLLEEKSIVNSKEHLRHIIYFLNLDSNQINRRKLFKAYNEWRYANTVFSHDEVYISFSNHFMLKKYRQWREKFRISNEDHQLIFLLEKIEQNLILAEEVGTFYGFSEDLINEYLDNQNILFDLAKKEFSLPESESILNTEMLSQILAIIIIEGKIFDEKFSKISDINLSPTLRRIFNLIESSDLEKYQKFNFTKRYALNLLSAIQKSPFLRHTVDSISLYLPSLPDELLLEIFPQFLEQSVNISLDDDSLELRYIDLLSHYIIESKKINMDMINVFFDLINEFPKYQHPMHNSIKFLWYKVVLQLINDIKQYTSLEEVLIQLTFENTFIKNKLQNFVDVKLDEKSWYHKLFHSKKFCILKYNFTNYQYQEVKQFLGELIQILENNIIKLKEISSFEGFLIKIITQDYITSELEKINLFLKENNIKSIDHELTVSEFLDYLSIYVLFIFHKLYKKEFQNLVQKSPRENNISTLVIEFFKNSVDETKPTRIPKLLITDLLYSILSSNIESYNLQISWKYFREFISTNEILFTNQQFQRLIIKIVNKPFNLNLANSLSELIDFIQFDYDESLSDSILILYALQSIQLKLLEFVDFHEEIKFELTRVRTKKPLLLNLAILHKILKEKFKTNYMYNINKLNIYINWYDFQFIGLLTNHIKKENLTAIEVLPHENQIREMIYYLKNNSLPLVERLTELTINLDLSSNYLHSILMIMIFEENGINELVHLNKSTLNKWLSLITNIISKDRGFQGVTIPLAYGFMNNYFISLKNASEPEKINSIYLLNHILSNWNFLEADKMIKAIENDTYTREIIFDYHVYLMKYRVEIEKNLSNQKEEDLVSLIKFLNRFGELSLDIFGYVISEIYKLHPNVEEINKTYKHLLVKDISYNHGKFRI